MAPAMTQSEGDRGRAASFHSCRRPAIGLWPPTDDSPPLGTAPPPRPLHSLTHSLTDGSYPTSALALRLSVTYSGPHPVHLSTEGSSPRDLAHCRACATSTRRPGLASPPVFARRVRHEPLPRPRPSCHRPPIASTAPPYPGPAPSRFPSHEQGDLL